MQLTSIPTMVILYVLFKFSLPQITLRPTFDIIKAIDKYSHLYLIRMGKTRARPAIQQYLQGKNKVVLILKKNKIKN